MLLFTFGCTQSGLIFPPAVMRSVKFKFCFFIHLFMFSLVFFHSETLAGCQHELRSNLKKKFECVFEGIAKAGNPTPLNQIYTELYITEGESGELNEEHEVRQIETASRKPARPETPIKCEDIFKPLPGRDQPIRAVMTKGVAGIGKTVLTQKFTLDWAEHKANQHVHFTFPLTFRELNLLRGNKLSLVELLHHFFTETKEAGISRFEQFQVVLIFDGLDECRLPLDFKNNQILTDVTESTSVDVLLTNLIKGNLLPSAHLWITTRPAAANQIPPECVGMVTEVRGFTDPQKEEYFRKRFTDEEQASRIISHIKTSRSVHIMCHIPVFCWITATVLEDVLKTSEGGDLPKTLTEMYIHFLVVQSKVQNIKYHGRAETDSLWTPETREMILSLGKLAFEELEKGNLIFYEADLAECGIDIRAASVYSGVFTQIFKEERGLYQDKVFCFVHLSVQEFLAAVHVFVTFINSGVNLLSEGQSTSQLKHLYQSAVDKALQSPNGHLDLFLHEKQASRIISHIKTSRSLHIMCHIPVFCWITATVLEDVMKTSEGGDLPKTLTEMYIHFLVVQSKVQNIKYHGRAETDSLWTPETREMILSLGKLAFEELEKGNLIFYEADLAECGIDIRAASVYSGVFTQIFKEERGLYQDKVFCFVHLSVQEFLAAVHVFLTFINSGVNLLSEEQSTSQLKHLYQSAVDKALQSPNGHLDLFLRFLLGLSLQTNQILLQGLLTQTGSGSQTSQETVQFIKEKIRDNPSPERSINLFHCLNELNDHSLVEEIQQYLSSGRLSTDKLSPAQWSALVFILLSSEEDLEVFDLKKYSASEEALLGLLPLVKASRRSV
uniref:NACHT domain-containing protein n=1 Tax=Myripristis murdjan TaxID=586833 RepID=A0A668A457_9TELE